MNTVSVVVVFVLFVAVSARKKVGCAKGHPATDELEPRILSPLPHTYTSLEMLPREFDWRNVGGESLVTADLNQHIPQYCGSCWLHASISSLNDRLKIARKGQFPEINLARQVVLNCGNGTAGSCGGGSDYGTYVFANRFGIPDDTCQLYSADSSFGCTAFRNCMNCDPRTPKAPNGVCYPVQSYDRYFVTEYGRMENPSVHEMKAEIFRRGPISCHIDSSFIENGKYAKGGIVRDSNEEWSFDHLVSVAGWGVDGSSNEEYWIVRNSWGTFWGDKGWFKVVTGRNAIGIEDLCSWAVVDPNPIHRNWGPSDIGRMFQSGVVPPAPDSDERNAKLFGFVTPSDHQSPFSVEHRDNSIIQ